MGSSESLRSVIDVGRSRKRLDELSSARVIGKIALQLHAAQQKAGHGKAVGPVTPAHITLAPSGEATLELAVASALGYSSPEQVAGGATDRRSDVFSLGTVLWEVLTHARLFDAMNDAAVRIAVQERDIVPPAEINANVPAELSAICMRALQRNPADRYQSLKAMAVEIEEFLEEAGYEDSDDKIARHLASMHEPAKSMKIAMPPLQRPATSTPAPPFVERPTGTQPPPGQLVHPAQPAQPTILGEPPQQDARPKSPSGAALAAALAHAGAQQTASRVATSPQVGLPPASAAATAIGVPKLDDWQDGAPPSHAPPPAAAPIVPVDPAAPTSVASKVGSGAVQTPQAPVLPGSAARGDRQTLIAGSVPIPKAMVEAKHVEAKQPALIVEDKPKALIVDTPPPGDLASAAAQAVDAKPPAQIVDTPRPGDLASAAAQAVDAKPPAQIVDTPPLGSQAQPTEVKPAAQIVDTPPPGRLETMTTLVDAQPPAIDVPKLVDGKLPDAALPSAIKPSAVETVPVSAVAPPPATAAATAVDASEPAKLRAPSQSDAVPGAQAAMRSAPHPANAVSLGPIPGSTRDSKDVLAGWGWGTDKHDAIPPESYSGDDDYDVAPPDSKKTLMYVIGGGLALAALVTIIAFASGGSSDKKQSAAKQEQELTRPAIDRGAPAEPTTATEPDPGAAATLEPTTDPAADAARAAAESERAAQQELAAQQAAKQDAARLAAEQQRLADEKKAEQQRLADAKKAEQARKAELAKAEQARKAELAKAEQTRKPAPSRAAKVTAPTAKKSETVAARPSKADAETAYRAGLQQFARGDTTGALASLRTSLAGNPNHAPTWRGLGLVFEKMGERDQARAAYKRYLQLAPGAGDAEQIRSRLERLGS